MKISFVIPAHNEEALLAACLESILREISSGPYDAEIIVVNNASTDSTREVALSFPGVRVVDEEKKGLVMARHAGFIAASGDIVANIDADVVLTPGWLSTVHDEFTNNERLVALSGPFIYHDLSLVTRGMVKVFYFFGLMLSLLYQHIFHIGALLQGGNFIIKRETWAYAGGYDTSITFYGEDIDVAKRMSKHGIVKWTFKLPAYSSGRRLKGEGVIRSALRYTINNWWVTFFGRPFTHRYKDIRPE